MSRTPKHHVGLNAEQLDLIANIVAFRAPSVLFKTTVKLQGCLPVLVRLNYPGVINIFDPATGKLLAEGYCEKRG